MYFSYWDCLWWPLCFNVCVSVIRNYQHFFWNRLQGLNLVRKPISRHTVAVRVLYWSNNCYWYTCHRRILKGDFGNIARLHAKPIWVYLRKNVGFIEIKKKTLSFIFYLIYLYNVLKICFLFVILPKNCIFERFLSDDSYYITLSYWPFTMIYSVNLNLQHHHVITVTTLTYAEIRS